MKLSRAVQDYLDDCRLKRRSPATLVTYGNALGFLVRLAMLHNRDEVGTCTPSLVREYFAIASERENQMETLLKKRSVLRGFTRWGIHRRLWLADPMADAPEYRKPGRLPRPFERRERDVVEVHDGSGCVERHGRLIRPRVGVERQRESDPLARD